MSLMTFTDQLYKQTKDSHQIVDKHPFVNLIKTNKCVSNLYINFNKICISIIQETLDESKQYDSFCLIYKKLYREKLYNTDDIHISKNLSKLLLRCEEYPLEHAYMFYLGLLYGGNMLSKSLKNNGLNIDNFLTFKNPTELIKEFKEYLNANVNDQTNFIKIVNESYNIISLVFDDYHKQSIC